MVTIRFLVLLEMRLRHPLMMGALSQNQLTVAKIVDGRGDVTWRRHPGESCWAFEERIICDLRELMSAAEQTLMAKEGAL